MKISFIIPCYNNLQHTKACIESIIAHSKKETYNFIFINNASTDGTDKYIASIPNSITIHNDKNKYINHAWNQGLNIISKNDSEYLCLCHNDFIVCPNWLDPIFELFSTKIKEFYMPVSNTQPRNPFDDKKGMKYYFSNQEKTILLPISEPCLGFCIFIRKEHLSHFYPIPDQLKILRGDNWIMDNLYSKGILGYRVNKCVVFHENGTTQKILSTDQIRNNDIFEFNKIKNSIYKINKINQIESKYNP